MTYAEYYALEMARPLAERFLLRDSDDRVMRCSKCDEPLSRDGQHLYGPTVCSRAESATKRVRDARPDYPRNAILNLHDGHV
jgi:hypothetical protein